MAATEQGDPAMRWVRFSKDNAISYGSLNGDQVQEDQRRALGRRHPDRADTSRWRR